jgi:hypothetical protein
VAALEQLNQRAEAHAEPEIDQPAAIAVDGERRQLRLLAGPPAKAFMLVVGLFLVIGHARRTPKSGRKVLQGC